MCELLVGLPDVHILGVDDGVEGFLCIYIESSTERPGCAHCGVLAQMKDRSAVELVDLPCFGRPTRLIWHKCRWKCPEPSCPVGSWTEENQCIGAPRMAMSARAGRWVTEQVGRYARSVNEIATELGCDWPTVNDTVIAYGAALVDDPGRFGTVEAPGLDEVLFARVGPWHRQEFSTQIVDVGLGQLLDIVPGRSGEGPTAWLKAKGKDWRDQVRYATLDLSSPYRAWCSPPWCPTPSRWPIHFMWASSPTPRSTSVVAGCKTRPWGTGATRLTRSIGAVVS
jgi:transposase